MPLLRPIERDGHGNPIPDPEPAQKFKLLVRDLHVCLDNFHIEVTREEVVERISFRSVCLGRGANLPITVEFHRLRYLVAKVNGRWRSTVSSIANPADVGPQLIKMGSTLLDCRLMLDLLRYLFRNELVF
jgi:hypothetical protein